MFVQKLCREECLNFLKEIRFGRLGCVRDKQPYVVPIYFVSDGKHIYGFTTLGQKIRWMRENPVVCVEADQVIDQLHWTSVVVLGKYQELDDKFSLQGVREYALELLQHRIMWWQPAVATTRDSDSAGGTSPHIFYRIRIDEISGRRAGPDSLAETMPQPLKRRVKDTIQATVTME
jgi:nitroimidazol reductase NimA-like FMN-containing flavoprotein (pyridoxamine 5'-phosphate oxidase superfamily)